MLRSRSRTRITPRYRYRTGCRPRPGQTLRAGPRTLCLVLLCGRIQRQERRSPLTTQVGELKVQIQVNRASFDVGAAIAGTGALNDSGYLGAPAYHWQCQGISGQPQTEAVDGVQIRFWSITSNLVYRQRGWVAQLLDTGYNCIQPDGGLGPCKVITDAGPVEASMPMALNEDGTQAFNSSGGKIEVRKIERRLHPAVNFVSYFGTPPS